MVALLVFIIATLEIVFGRKRTVEWKRSIGDNVIKNPARYIILYKDCQEFKIGSSTRSRMSKEDGAETFVLRNTKTI